MNNNNIADLILKRSKPNKPSIQDKVMNYTKNKVSNAKDIYFKMSTTYKILFILGILICLYIIYILYSYYRESEYETMNGNLFITQPHNAKEIYRYNGLSYIHSYLFNDSTDGEFTFSIWIYIDSKQWNYRFGEWKHIFHRGSAPPNMDDNNVVKLTTQMPSLWLAPKENNIRCVVTTLVGQSGKEEGVMIRDVELNRWFNVSIVVQNSSLTVYKDCKIEEIINLNGKIIINRDAVYVNNFGGFGGYVAYLQYFNRALVPSEVRNICKVFGGKFEKHRKYLMEREMKKVEYNLDDRTVCKDKGCNYLAEVKKEKDAMNYKKNVVDVYKILCRNTYNTDDNCKKQIEQLEQLLAKSDITFTNSLFTSLKNSIKPMGNGYQYDNIDGNKRVAYITADEYKTIMEK